MAPATDLNNLPPLKEIKGGSVSNLHKAELLGLAKALGITMPPRPSDVTKADLSRDIKAALEATSDVGFLKFKVHRPDTTGGAALKNSADKAKEDSEASAKKADTAPSGANKKLLELGTKTDPPAQHKRLGGGLTGAGSNAKAKVEDSAHSELSSLESEGEEEIDTPSGAKNQGVLMGQEPKDPVFTSGNVNHTAMQGDIAPAEIKPLDMDECPIVITFLGSSENREIWILPAQRGDVRVSKTPEGAYVSSWKQVIPNALVQFSPAKGSQNLKISVNGPTGNPLPLGTADDFMKGTLPPVLSLDEADTCTLIQKGSMLVCEVFLGPGRSGLSDTVKAEDSAYTGKIKPLVLARERRQMPKPKAGKRPRDFADSDEDVHKDNPEFLAFLCTILHSKKEGYGKSLKTVGEQRERFIDLDTAIIECDANYASLSRGTAVYRILATYADHVNEEYRKFTNCGFNKREIESALNIGHTIASQDRQLFKSALLVHDPVAQSWVNGDKDLDQTVVDEFDQMTCKQFLERLQKAADDATKAREKSEKKRKRNDRKHVSGSSDD
ncbi:hypothetical protein DFH07DRAFT_976934 [Mycena maculata]|uniref:Uncharacterized protein n=1 Tax=Mycena maculata TaxID=230809 RepID=A0AAD7NVN2_9AGAR|nr:hypothetical protein DFH07DRAFT_976934 [Mycena maculata]